MIAIIKHIYDRVAETVRFAAAVWHEARTLQAETSERYGSMF